MTQVQRTFRKDTLMLSQYYDALLDRFTRYVKIDTQSDPECPDYPNTYPSTQKQLDLLNLLKRECEAMGLHDVECDCHGYVTATLPSNVNREVKTVGFIAHVDTSPEVSGANVKPIVHKNYQGNDIVLPDRNDVVIKFDDNPELAEHIGNDIITASGTTLLGADNKSGVAAIMTAMSYLVDHPEIPHGDIRIGFTPDEEIGGGTIYFDIEKFNAYCAYTVDSSTRGMLDTETFSADSMSITFYGINTHPGHAYHQMINAIKLVSEFIERLPKEDLSPETTKDRQGFVDRHQSWRRFRHRSIHPPRFRRRKPHKTKRPSPLPRSSYRRRSPRLNIRKRTQSPIPQHELRSRPIPRCHGKCHESHRRIWSRSSANGRSRRHRRVSTLSQRTPDPKHLRW